LRSLLGCVSQHSLTILDTDHTDGKTATNGKQTFKKVPTFFTKKLGLLNSKQLRDIAIIFKN